MGIWYQSLECQTQQFHCATGVAAAVAAAMWAAKAMWAAMLACTALAPPLQPPSMPTLMPTLMQLLPQPLPTIRDACLVAGACSLEPLVREPDFPLDLTGFFLGKHLIQLSENEMQGRVLPRWQPLLDRVIAWGISVPTFPAPGNYKFWNLWNPLVIVRCAWTEPSCNQTLWCFPVLHACVSQLHSQAYESGSAQSDLQRSVLGILHWKRKQLCAHSAKKEMCHLIFKVCRYGLENWYSSPGSACLNPLHFLPLYLDISWQEPPPLPVQNQRLRLSKASMQRKQFSVRLQYKFTRIISPWKYDPQSTCILQIICNVIAVTDSFDKLDYRLLYFYLLIL